MKIDFVKTIIAVAISCLIAYGLYAICKVDELRCLLTIVSGIAMTITLAFTLGIKPKAERTALMFTTMSAIFFVVVAIMNLIFAFVNFNKPIFIILNGVILLVYALIANSMAKVKE